MKFKPIILILLFTGLIGLALYTSQKENDEVNKQTTVTENTGLKPGSKAPDFKLNTLEGKQILLKEYRGKKVILNFWATWCPPCRKEMPEMQKFYKEYKQKDVEILAVNLEYSETKPEKIRDFVKEYKLEFPIPLDEKNTIGKQFRAVSIPTSYFIDEEGTITHMHVGPMDYTLMEEEIMKMK
ncbi:peroxiredoxin family protein [Fictibacillus phosphorivorans]|uniref:peroxiredoxin family protein n=1 Tax=Fictibacillus phosphorivorans TaxID=1221500 RepID=UPI0020413FD0|nr:TlpA disulfide reductase family protein [Fictibacillus phosphorivorans]MCM3717431.1 TlpA family protein disulfide reductase [Fictibacillus phosphorivorans]MCM3775126.1 TlpA family protein disulfide reductase [Fictibacillus phosphorivorans]